MDGSQASIAALWEAVALAEDLGASVLVLHVNATEPRAAGAAAAEEELDMGAAIVDAESRLGLRLSRKTLTGDPERKIIETAEAEHSDLIVMGTHGRVGRLHALIGSVAESIVRNAPCPVLTVREPGGEEESFAERIHHRRGISRPSQ